MEIRPLREDDVDAVVAFGVEAWEPVFASFERELGPRIYAAMFPDWRASQAKVIADGCRADEHRTLVAVDDDRPVGFAVIGPVDEDAAKAGELHMIAVDPARQGEGIAAALMERALEEIRALGVDLAVIGTGGDAGHAPARALYERFGFRPLPLVRYYRSV